MSISCTNWKDCGVNGGGCCTINEYNRPSFGVCLLYCTKYDGPDRAEAIKQLNARTASPTKPSNGQLISSFAAATTALLRQGRIPRAAASVRLTICTGEDEQGRQVQAPCVSYQHTDGPRGEGHCGSCGCPQWTISKMKRKVWYPYPICPKGLFPTVQGRRAKAKEVTKA